VGVLLLLPLLLVHQTSELHRLQRLGRQPACLLVLVSLLVVVVMLALPPTGSRLQLFNSSSSSWGCWGMGTRPTKGTGA
jgi:hypothetical protein